ncbi:MAG: anti-sigma factor family protein [Verrucomicrobiaceae bacterium]
MKKEIIEELLVKSVDGTLAKDESEQLKILLAAKPELQGEVETMRNLKQTMQDSLPVSVEPPYPDFFNSRLMRKIELEVASNQPKEKAKNWWASIQWAWLPAGALSLVLAFLAGQRLSSPVQDGQMVSQRTTNDLPSVYFAEESLNAEVISDSDGHVSAIVVSGLNAINDNAAFADSTAALPVSYRRFEADQFH